MILRRDRAVLGDEATRYDRGVLPGKEPSDGRARRRLGAALLLGCACVALLLTASAAAQVGAAASAAPRPDPMREIPPLMGTTTRDCRQVEVPGTNDGSLMEIDVFGKPAPTCRAAVRRLEAAVQRLPAETWGRVGEWRCIWSVPEVYCGHHRVRIYAANPGD